MPSAPDARSLRGVVIVQAAAILGVLALALTALVAAPNDSTRAAASPAAPAHSPLRLISWSNQVWIVDPPNEPGPHMDPATDSPKAAYVDKQGRLHLAVQKVGKVWKSVQLESLGAINYGTYTFVTDSSIATLAKPLDFAMFVFRSGTKGLTNEIDLENGRSLIDMVHGRTSQYVVQPYYRPHHIYRYPIRRNVGNTVQSFTWNFRRVHFVTRQGSSTGPLISAYNFHGRDVPTNVGEHVYIDLFLHGKQKTVDPGVKYAILDSYTYTPTAATG